MYNLNKVVTFTVFVFTNYLQWLIWGRLISITFCDNFRSTERNNFLLHNEKFGALPSRISSSWPLWLRQIGSKKVGDILADALTHTWNL